MCVRSLSGVRVAGGCVRLHRQIKPCICRVLAGVCWGPVLIVGKAACTLCCDLTAGGWERRLSLSCNLLIGFPMASSVCHAVPPVMVAAYACVPVFDLIALLEYG
jgi:hypothetical protein